MQIETLKTKTVTIDETQIVVNRQALLAISRALDIGARENLPGALDKLREPFFKDEIVTGTARRDFSVNKYEYGV